MSPLVSLCPLTSPHVLLWTPPHVLQVLPCPFTTPMTLRGPPVPPCAPLSPLKSLCVPSWGPTSPYVPHVLPWAPPVPTVPPMSLHVPSCPLETPRDGLPLCGGKSCRCDPHGPRPPRRSHGQDLHGDEIFAHQILGNMARVGHGWDVHGGSLPLTAPRRGSPGVEVSGRPGHHGWDLGRRDVHGMGSSGTGSRWTGSLWTTTTMG